MMLDTISTEKGKWYNSINAYREELEISWEDLIAMSKPELKRKINDYDTDKWYTGLNNKITMRFYAQGKTKFGYENCYRNNHNSTFLARARINSLKLEEHKGRGNPNYDKTCKLCRKGIEDIVHFLIDCEELEEDRNYHLIDDTLENSEEKMIKLLFQNESFQNTGYMIKSLWKRRKTILKYNQMIESGKKKDRQAPNPRIYQNSDPGPMRRGHGSLGGRSKRKSMDRG